MSAEIISLVPREVLDKAKELSKVGLYESALEILQQNRVEVEVHNDYVQMRIATGDRFPPRITNGRIVNGFLRSRRRAKK
jgi:hypothetical protein